MTANPDKGGWLQIVLLGGAALVVYMWMRGLRIPNPLTYQPQMSLLPGQPRESLGFLGEYSSMARCAEFTSNQYVGAKGSGFVVVIGGREIGFYTDLQQAQEVYMMNVCGGINI